MKRSALSSFAAALLGGGVTAGVRVGAGVVDRTQTETIFQQSPLAAVSRPASDTSVPKDVLTARDIYKRDAPGVVYIRSHIIQASQSPFDMFGGGQQDSEA